MTGLKHGTIMAAALTLSARALFAADNFPNAFEAAMKLKDNPAAAEAAFVSLAEAQTPSWFQKIRQRAAYYQAAECAAVQGQFDRASALADKIADPTLKILATMKRLERQNKSKELLELARGEPIETWPEAIIYDAALCRAAAALAQGDHALAQKDYALAARYTLDSARRAATDMGLGDVFGAMGKKAEAEGSYRKVLESDFAPEDFKKSAKVKLNKLGQ